MAGLTQAEIARRLKSAKQTISTDLKAIEPEKNNALPNILPLLQNRILELYPVERNAQAWVAMATTAKTESVRYTAMLEINKLLGVIPEIERVRAKQQERLEPAPMFILPMGANVAITVNQVAVSSRDTSISSHDTLKPVRDVSPTDVSVSDTAGAGWLPPGERKK